VTPSLKAALDDARGALGAAEKMLTSTETNLVGPGAPGQVELRNAMQELARAARSLRVLADYLETPSGVADPGQDRGARAEMKRVPIIFAALALARMRELAAVALLHAERRAVPTAPASAMSIVVGSRDDPCGGSTGRRSSSPVGDNEVWLDEFNRWASPLGEAIAIATAEDLGGLLSTARATSIVQSAAPMPTTA
jgi:hypothetical protein